TSTFVVGPRSYRANRADSALYLCLTPERAHSDRTAAGAPRAPPGAAAPHGPRDLRPARDRPANGASVRGGAAEARHPGRGATWRRRGLPDPTGVPAAAAHADRGRSRLRPAWGAGPGAARAPPVRR